MAYDPTTRTVVMVTENQGTQAETWTWDGTAWRHQT